MQTTSRTIHEPTVYCDCRRCIRITRPWLWWRLIILHDLVIVGIVLTLIVTTIDHFFDLWPRLFGLR